ncbi:MAG TPA: hypothetical protein VMY36_02880 [Patescibacteria group bacterium]|nr:hypothetical protein [Patescibacteria group bacterium]
MENSIKRVVRPITETGKIVLKITKKDVLEKVAPQKPNDAPSLKRQFLENFFRKV